MFDIGFLRASGPIAVVALIVIGTERLPKVAGTWAICSGACSATERRQGGYQPEMELGRDAQTAG